MLDFSRLEQYRENNRIEAKKALGGLPKSIWETYSAFANTLGGIILLGVVEETDKSLRPIRLPDPGRLIEEFLELLNRPEKASVNILSDQDISVETVEGCQIIAITVPRAERRDRPVYIDGNPFTGTYQRNGEGDYRCSKEEVEAMFRDASRKSPDMRPLCQLGLHVLDPDAIRRYRSRMILRHPEHIWQELDTPEFLYKLGAAAKAPDDSLCPTAAGLLMFGYEYEIIREFSGYFLDYQDLTVSEQDARKFNQARRIVSSSGDWSGSLYDFYFRVSRALASSAEPAPVQDALREALTNCLINADYSSSIGVSIRKTREEIRFSNPGSFRIAIENASGGGISDPRNAALCRMFNLIDVGERTGSGLPNIFRVWKEQGLPVPSITQEFSPERTILALTLQPAGQTKKTSSGTAKASKAAPAIRKALIIDYLTEHVSAGARELSSLTGASVPQIQRLLSRLVQEGIVVREGGTRNRTFRLKS